MHEFFSEPGSYSPRRALREFFSWIDNARCRARSRSPKPDYARYFPARGGHVVDRSDLGNAIALDEIDAGSQCASAQCCRCGEWVGINLANGLEEDGDPTPYFPSDPERWRNLNGLD